MTSRAYPAWPVRSSVVGIHGEAMIFLRSPGRSHTGRDTEDEEGLSRLSSKACRLILARDGAARTVPYAAPGVNNDKPGSARVHRRSLPRSRVRSDYRRVACFQRLEMLTSTGSGFSVFAGIVKTRPCAGSNDTTGASMTMGTRQLAQRNGHCRTDGTHTACLPRDIQGRGQKILDAEIDPCGRHPEAGLRAPRIFSHISAEHRR